VLSKPVCKFVQFEKVGVIFHQAIVHKALTICPVGIVEHCLEIVVNSLYTFIVIASAVFECEPGVNVRLVTWTP
jgi:hypothetical protein